MVKGLAGITYEKQLRVLCLYSFKKRRLEGDFIFVYSFLMTGSGEGGVDLSGVQ